MIEYPTAVLQEIEERFSNHTVFILNASCYSCDIANITIIQMCKD